MPAKQKLREPLAGSLNLEAMSRRFAEGWRPAAIEWEREGAGESPAPAAGEWTEDIPYGLQVSEDCGRLVENPAESEIILLALDLIVDDCPLSRVADELNRRGYRTRPGAAWSPTALFDLLPRMIQAGPRLFTSDKWISRRERLPRLAT
jgi:hypothetical protein